MPYTPAQRRLFHEISENPDAARRHGISRREGHKLAEEADRLAREGHERKPINKKAAKAILAAIQKALKEG